MQILMLMEEHLKILVDVVEWPLLNCKSESILKIIVFIEN